MNLHFIVACATLFLLQSMSIAQTQRHVKITEGPSLPLAVGGHAGGLVEGLPVVVGGTGWSTDRTVKFWSEKSFVFRSGKWTEGPSLPAPRADMAYASDESGLYVAGGTEVKLATRDVFRLSSTKPDAKWETLTPLPEAIEAASGVIHNGVLYVIGGYSSGAPSNRVWSLDLKSPNATWIARAPLPAKGRGWSAAVVVNDSIYVFGGFTYPPFATPAELFGDGYRFDIASNTWTELKDLNFPGYGWNATHVGENKILFTGRCDVIGQIKPDVWLLSLDDLSKQNIGKLVIQSCCMPVIKVAGNIWWFPGGEPAADRIRTAVVTVIQFDDTAKP